MALHYGAELQGAEDSMKILMLLGPIILLVLLVVTVPAAAECDARGGVQFVCDQSGPEDLVAVPGSPWVVASSYPEGNFHPTP